MNVINAIIHLVNHPVTELVSRTQGRNRVNNVGDALEEYVKDLFADTFHVDVEERMKRQSEVFSYLGNKNNPPDAMLKNGDAIEVKKIESDNAALALNSSYPKHKLCRNNPMIAAACKNAEDWDEKDILYVIGVVGKTDNTLRHLCMVYGTEYCASEVCYQKIKEVIKNGVESIEGIEFSESNELGHINKVDPLGITYMRVRGMWGIQNPWKVFDYIYQRDKSKKLNFMCIISEKKWNTLENRGELAALAEQTESLNIVDKVVKNPDNPADLIAVKLISFSV